MKDNNEVHSRCIRGIRYTLQSNVIKPVSEKEVINIFETNYAPSSSRYFRIESTVPE